MRRSLLLALLFAAFVPHTAAASPRIVGGDDVKAGEFPFVANISIAGSLGCTGSLIAPQWVMTAGHCGSTTGEIIGTPAAFPAAAYTVTLNTVNADGTGGESHSVSEVDIDPDYTGSSGNDVSLLKLDEPSKVTPVLIAALGERSLWAVGKLETIAGFGTTAEDGDAPKTMQVAQVPIVSDADCAKAYPGGIPGVDNPAFEADSMVCAGYPKGGTDTCQGDSGGPLMAQLTAGAYRLVGATSYGQGCAEAGFPGVYARIADVKIRKFVEGLVPTAYAPEPTAATTTTTTTPSSSPAPAATSTPTATPTAAPTATPEPGTIAGLLKTKRCSHRARITFGRHLRRARVVIRGRTIYSARGSRIARFRYRLPRAKATLRIIVVSRDGTKRVFVRRYSDCKLKSTRRVKG